ncbi:MAG: class I SAM-dependent methyltransferase [Candidatus Methanofastidiosa archaeon]|nr:class I SAM-dependent methyltransferase [Candidatus Methanofastidiosa archaeon]
MVKPRVIETDEGIQEEFTVEVYDRMLRGLRDKGWMETNQIIKSGINNGLALEVGPGPGYLGLEWLKNTDKTKLMGIEISPAMIKMATKNSKEYGFEKRVKYVKGDAQKMPFENNYFDGVFSNGSLHEWSQPKKIFNEIYRVLKPGGMYFISELKRDMNFLLKWFMYYNTNPKEIRSGLISSINAAYTVEEIFNILKSTKLKDAKVTKNFMGIEISGDK